MIGVFTVLKWNKKKKEKKKKKKPVFQRSTISFAKIVVSRGTTFPYNPSFKNKKFETAL